MRSSGWSIFGESEQTIIAKLFLVRFVWVLELFWDILLYYLLLVTVPNHLVSDFTTWHHFFVVLTCSRKKWNMSKVDIQVAPWWHVQHCHPIVHSLAGRFRQWAASHRVPPLREEWSLVGETKKSGLAMPHASCQSEMLCSRASTNPCFSKRALFGEFSRF